MKCKNCAHYGNLEIEYEADHLFTKKVFECLKFKVAILDSPVKSIKCNQYKPLCQAINAEKPKKKPVKKAAKKARKK